MIGREIGIGLDIQQATLVAVVPAVDGRHTAHRFRETSVLPDPQPARLFGDEQSAAGEHRHPPWKFEGGQLLDPDVAGGCRERSWRWCGWLRLLRADRRGDDERGDPSS